MLDFLARFTEECDTLGMSEGQAFMALPKFLSKTASTQYRARQHGGSSGGITCWPEAVQYLLRTYATPSAIRKATSDLRSVQQLENEDESAYAARVSEAAYRCGNVLTEDEKMTIFVDGLQPEIRTTVARYREDQPRYEMTLERLIHHAQDEGDALRARISAEQSRNNNRQLAPLTIRLQSSKTSPPPGKQKETRQVTFLEPTETVDSDVETTQDQDGLLALSEATPDDSVNTSDLLSTITDLDPTQDQEELLILLRQQERRRAQGTPYLSLIHI